MARIDGRAYKDLRPVEIIPGVNKFAEGSCLIRCGNTHVLCYGQRGGAGPAPCPLRRGMGDGRVFYAAPRQPGAQPPGCVQGQALPPFGGDPAPGGPRPAGVY